MNHTPTVSADHKNGFVLQCTMQEVVLAIVHDGGVLRDRNAVGQPWTDLLDDGSLTKAKNFMAVVETNGAAFNWELNVSINNRIKPHWFAGIIFNDDLMIVGAPTDYDLATLVQDLRSIGNSQTNILRAVFKENARLRQVTDDSTMFEEISRLNNELVTLQRQLVKKNYELEGLNELKNRFLGIAAHDLRNPLNNIHYLVEFLEEESDDYTEAQRAYMQQIQEISQFMLALVEDLLDVAAIEDGKIELRLQLADLAALVRECVNFQQNRASQKEIVISLSAPDSLVMEIDPEKINQVLDNLLSNAIKYSPPATRVDVSLTTEPEEVTLVVRDEGQGIAKGEQPLLFKPFKMMSSRTTGGEKSTGLGLYIVKRIVEAHNGRIWVESALGQGAAFNVTLPVGL